MVVFRKKKVKKQRGHKTHGWGSMKKHRGAGHRGGRGKAGTGKRGDAKKPSYWKERYFGKRGFTSRSKTKVKPVNVSYFEEKLPVLIAEKKATEKDGLYVVDVLACGFNKVLGSGKLTKKLSISAPHISATAQKKIEAAGGKVITEERAQ